MSPIYKTGWGQYVDLSKIVSIETDKYNAISIHFQLCEKPVTSPHVSLCGTHAFSNYHLGGPTPTPEQKEEDKAEVDGKITERQYQINLLISAWESYHNA